MSSCVPRSYYGKKELSAYAQRLWWCYYTDKINLVNATLEKCEDKTIGDAYARCWRVRFKKYDGLTYVAVLKRFLKPVSYLAVCDWLGENYPDAVRGQDNFRIWHPSRPEILNREIDDYICDNDNYIRNEVWSNDNEIVEDADIDILRDNHMYF
jgi:hypothetical protein